ncbi:MAG: Gfo/Idh/MocA family protein [Candidatus Brocadiia bacterium]
MDTLKAGLIGCGGRGHAHAVAYDYSDKVELVACADISEEAAGEMAEEFDTPNTYSDYEEMLANEDLDIVAMALWIGLHHDAIMAIVNADNPPELINAEKPMAPTFGEAKRMYEACEEAGIMMTFSHQRRFGASWSKAKEILDEGAIGELWRMEAYCSNLFDWGTHWFDMMFFYNNQEPAEWVMGQIDCSEKRTIFGALVETSGLSYIKWQNGVMGLIATGQDHGGRCQNLLIGAEGMIEVNHDGVRLLREGENWQSVELEELDVPGGATTRYLLESIDCLLEGKESLLSSKKALQATELIFATYESARRRARVHLPLDIEDSPLLSMIEDGEIVLPEE